MIKEKVITDGMIPKIKSCGEAAECGIKAVHIINGAIQHSMLLGINPDNNMMKYEEAMRQLQEIVRKMENDELDIDQMSDQLKKAQELIKICRDKLTKTDEEIQKLLNADTQGE